MKVTLSHRVGGDLGDSELTLRELSDGDLMLTVISHLGDEVRTVVKAEDLSDAASMFLSRKREQSYNEETRLQDEVYKLEEKLSNAGLDKSGDL